MDKNKKKKIIKSLLSGRLTKQRRRDFADLDPVDKEIRKQWDESGRGLTDTTLKEQIWKMVKERCEHKKSNKVLVELRKPKPLK